MNARYYNSETGQFISKDTYLGEAYSPWTQNLYSYTGNNPVNFTDPTGHKFIGLSSAIGGLIQSSKNITNIRNKSTHGGGSRKNNGKSFSKDWIKNFNETFVSVTKKSSRMLLFAGSITQLDSPLPGPADVAGVFLAAGTILYAATVSFIQANRTFDDSDSKTVTKELSIPNPKQPVVFPENPLEFRPLGLEMHVYKGSENGAIIKWSSPADSKNAVFEWNEDFKYNSHYHIRGYSNTHYLPLDPVPEPYATIYFPYR